MTADTNKPVARSGDEDPAAGRIAAAGTGNNPGDSLSMHADVPVWCDCCTCEAEPYWLEAFRETDAEAGFDDGGS